MSIRLIAKDLYRLIGEIDQLEKKIRNAPVNARPELMDQMRKLKAQRDELRRMLEGSKEATLPKLFR